MLLRLLGTPQIEIGQEIRALPLRRSSWLLFYLAYSQDWVQREDLVRFLRPESTKEVGSLYLRQLLTDARKLSWVHNFEVEADRLRWKVDTDVSYFKTAAVEGRWFEAINFYRGPFLKGLQAGYLPAYEAWIDTERASLEQLWRDVSLNYLYDLESSGLSREATAVAKAIYDKDSLDEEALHSYLRNAYSSGQRHQALQIADDFTETIREEFGLEPTAETLELVELIREGQSLIPRATRRRYGRRRSDRLKVASTQAEHLQEITEILKTPNNRLLAINATSGKQGTLLIATHVTDIEIALSAMVVLAEQLIASKHHERALEVLIQVWNHQSSTLDLKEHIVTLCREFNLQFPLVLDHDR